MKTVSISVFLFSLLVVFACNNNQSNKAKDSEPNVKKLPSEKSIPKKEINTEQKEYKSCEEVVKEIVITSPRYEKLTNGLQKAVINNGGSSFGVSLEGSPNPAQDKAWTYAKTYDYILYESYPDRQINTARFSFDPNTEQLYEYDLVNNKLIPLEFNRSLLVYYEKLYK